MKALHRGICGLIVAALLLATGTGVSAQTAAEVCTPPQVSDPDQALTALNRLRVAGCLGGRRCDSSLCRAVTAFEERWRDKPPTDITYREARAQVEAVRASAATLPPAGVAVPELQRMFAAWGQALGGNGTLSVTQLRSMETRQWEPEPGDYRLFARSPDAQVVLKDVLEDRCHQGAAACTTALAEGSDVITHSLLVHRVLRVALGADAVLAPYFETLRARWSAYNNASRAIYPWELAANARLLRASTQGFAQPPERQILLLHPGAGMTYKPGQGDKDSETRGAITLDLIGLYRWRWGGADGAQITGANGWSIAAGWDGRDVGYGLGLHFSDSRSVYLMRDRSARTLLIVSLDLGNYLRGKEAAVDEMRAKAGPPR